MPQLSPRLQNFLEFQYPSIVGQPILRSEEQAGDIAIKDIMCGDEAAAARSMLQISYPVLFLQPSDTPAPLEKGIVKKWDDKQHLNHLT